MFSSQSNQSGGHQPTDDQEEMFRQKVQMLWKEDCLVDVTLACSNKLLTAHKLVLSAYSDYFKEIFSTIRTNNQYPIIFMKDISGDVLEAILQFMYCGEVNVAQQNLESFMHTAKTLQIKGLSLADDVVQSEPQGPPEKRSRVTESPNNEQMWTSPIKKVVRSYNETNFSPTTESQSFHKRAGPTKRKSSTMRQSAPKQPVQQMQPPVMNGGEESSHSEPEDDQNDLDESDNELPAIAETLTPLLSAAYPKARLLLDVKLEAKLWKFVEYLSEITPVTANQVRMFAWAVDAVIGGNILQDIGPSKEWWLNFKDRFPEVKKTLRNYDFLQSINPRSFSMMSLPDYLIPVQEVMEAFDLANKASYLWSVSEYSIDTDHVSDGILPGRRRFARSGNANAFSDAKVMSMLFAGSAAGERLPLFTVAKTTKEALAADKENFTTSSDDNGGSSFKTLSGYVDGDAFMRWFETTFLTHCPRDRMPERPVVLVLETLFPLVSSRMLQMALQENIVLLPLLPHMHCACQPTDKPVIFGLSPSFTAAYTSSLIRDGEEKTKERMHELLRTAAVDGVAKAAVVQGFSACGLYPLTVAVDVHEYTQLRQRAQLEELAKDEISKDKKLLPTTYGGSTKAKTTPPSTNKSEFTLSNSSKTKDEEKPKSGRNLVRSLNTLAAGSGDSSSEVEEEFGDGSSACYVCGKDRLEEKDGEFIEQGRWVKCSKRSCQNYSCDECLPVNFAEDSLLVCIDCAA